MKKIVLLVCLFQLQIASAYELRPSIPREGQEVSVGLYFFCPEYPATTADGQTHHFEVLSDNTIRLTVVLLDGIGGCVGGIPPITAYFSLGDLPEGEYTLEVYSIFANQSFPPQNPQVWDTGFGTFQVLGAIAPVPALSNWSLILFISLCLLIVVKKLRKI